MKFLPLLSLISMPVIVGAVATWLWARRRHRTMIIERLERLAGDKHLAPPVTLIKQTNFSFGDFIGHGLEDLQLIAYLRSLVCDAGFEKQLNSIITLQLVLPLAVLVVGVAFALTPVVVAITTVCSIVLPLIVLNAKASARRRNFSEQLPDAVDLMVSVLRSGHSVPQSLRAVANEIPTPCGQEFEQILQRVSLGQPLGQSMALSAARFGSFELDLLRKAVDIQSEIGGSLAELLNNTNGTLRERQKLARQLKAITVQSRLSAYIVGCLPIALGLGLNTINHGYLQALFATKDGQMLTILAVCLNLMGLFIMHRMSTIKA